MSHCWSTVLERSSMGTKCIQNLYRSKSRKDPQDNNKPEIKKTKTTRIPNCQTISFPPDANYGPDAEEFEDPEAFKSTNFLDSLQVNIQERDKTVKETASQNESQMWHHLRRSRLTARNFGVVCKWKDALSCTNLVKNMEYGLRNEYIAIKRFERDSGLSVTKCGLFVDLEKGFLRASPDGLIKEENTVTEVKCVPSAIPQGLITTAKEKKGFFMEIMSENEMTLRRSHNYYQIQGTLNIIDCPVYYLVVMTNKNESLYIEKTFRDQTF
ncbi:hypothetical protein PR048_002293 [Dryococelus australis]|uniref:YqaJ viral recombinase domain-containing protein n=1 Tax=Dryococelus australis TaxID=614101 RepID=A0ABQ9IKG8_9NEOP|nr:hypothetical protein PR048_002293 [Dryococelus australis]